MNKGHEFDRTYGSVIARADRNDINILSGKQCLLPQLGSLDSDMHPTEMECMLTISSVDWRVLHQG